MVINGRKFKRSIAKKSDLVYAEGTYWKKKTELEIPLANLPELDDCAASNGNEAASHRISESKGIGPFISKTTENAMLKCFERWSK